jgi:hypothetical protein
MNKHLKILERYIPDLERITAVMNEYNASQNINETVTVELTVRRWCALPLVDEGMVLVCVLGFDLFRLCM